MKLKAPRMFLLRKHRPRPRKERTPYYFTDLTPALSAYILQSHRDFLEAFGRDYADEDPQFWSADHTGLKPRPVEAASTTSFLDRLAQAMKASNHHPAHIHAMLATRKIVFGCGTTQCHDLDECPRCNFRSVPEGWTKAWEQATREYEKWRGDVVAPTAADMAFVDRARRR